MRPFTALRLCEGGEGGRSVRGGEEEGRVPGSLSKGLRAQRFQWVERADGTASGSSREGRQRSALVWQGPWCAASTATDLP